MTNTPTNRAALEDGVRHLADALYGGRGPGELQALYVAVTHAAVQAAPALCPGDVPFRGPLVYAFARAIAGHYYDWHIQQSAVRAEEAS